MNRIVILTALVVFTTACDSGSINNNNPNIPNYNFTLEINMSLPSYNNLQFASNHIVNSSVGARGIVVFNTGSGFLAYDLACPNQSFSTCTSAMDIEGVEAVCDCDNAAYSLFTGQSSGQEYPMKQYRVEANGSILIVSN